MGLIFNHRDDITTKEADNDRQRTKKIADLIKARATVDELAEFKHFERREDRTAWVKNQIAKLENGELLL